MTTSASFTNERLPSEFELCDAITVPPRSLPRLSRTFRNAPHLKFEASSRKNDSYACNMSYAETSAYKTRTSVGKSTHSEQPRKTSATHFYTSLLYLSSISSECPETCFSTSLSTTLIDFSTRLSPVVGRSQTTARYSAMLRPVAQSDTSSQGSSSTALAKKKIYADSRLQYGLA